MRTTLFQSLFVAIAIWFASGGAAGALIPETNLWPLFVGEGESAEEPFDNWQGIGPLLFGRHNGHDHVYGLRPFYIAFHDEEIDKRDFHILYPFFNYRRRHLGFSWDILSMLRYHRTGSFGDDPLVNIRLSPIFFYGRGPQPHDASFGIFPLFGDVHTVFGQDRFRWLFFPLYGRMERDGNVLTMAPWPFIKFYQGENASGFDFWPFYGRRQIEDNYDRRFFLWPFGYHVRQELWKDEPFEAFGILPFYSRTRSERAESRSYIWPFFGYTESTDPEYSEKRYFWPLWVQRRGDDQYTNRWAPFYTRSIRRTRDRQWIMWPFYRHEKTVNRNFLDEKTQFFYFLYWSLRQTDPERPEAPPARKRHIWPLMSQWDDGAGRRQIQVLSPFEVFFQHNEIVRHNYSPLFALYQRDIDENEDRSRHSVLFRLLTWQRRAGDYRLNVGPVLRIEKEEETRSVEILKGLFGYNQDEGVTLFWLDFSRDGNEDGED